MDWQGKRVQTHGRKVERRRVRWEKKNMSGTEHTWMGIQLLTVIMSSLWFEQTRKHVFMQSKTRVCWYVYVFCLLGTVWACPSDTIIVNKQEQPNTAGCRHSESHIITAIKLTESSLRTPLSEGLCRLSALTAWWCVDVWRVWDSGSLAWSCRRHRGCGSSVCLESLQRLYGLSTDARRLKTGRKKINEATKQAERGAFSCYKSLSNIWIYVMLLITFR